MVSNSWFYFQEYVVLGLPFRVQKKSIKKEYYITIQFSLFMKGRYFLM